MTNCLCVQYIDKIFSGQVGQLYAIERRSYSLQLLQIEIYKGFSSILRGHTYMTSAVGGGGGSPKKQTKGTRLRELCKWQGGQRFVDLI